MAAKDRIKGIFDSAVGNAVGQWVFTVLLQNLPIWIPTLLLAGSSTVAAFFRLWPVAVIVFVVLFYVLAVYSYTRPGLVAGSKPMRTTTTRTGKFIMLNFTGAAVRVYDYTLSPYGVSWTSGIPFMILPYMEGTTVTGHQIVAVGPKHDGASDRNEITCNVPNVVKIYVVWTAGNGWKSWENVQYEKRRIGTLELVFSQGDPQRIPVVLGENIREWIYHNSVPQGVVDTLSDHTVNQVWESMDGLYTLDMKPIEVSNAPKDLRSVNLIGEFEIQTKIPGEALPHFHVSAITCEVSM